MIDIEGWVTYRGTAKEIGKLSKKMHNLTINNCKIKGVKGRVSLSSVQTRASPMESLLTIKYQRVYEQKGK